MMLTPTVRMGIGLLLFACLSGGSAAAATFYVDGQLKADCKGKYSVEKRDNSGTDGDAYDTIGEAADLAKAGDVVLIRGGVYNNATNEKENDILWPKHSGSADKPIIFRAYKGEEAILGQKGGRYPPEDGLSIARGTITLKGVSHIVVEGLTVKDVEAWVFARQCSHITFRKCRFINATNPGKGSVKFIESHHNRFEGCTFRKSGFDSLILNSSNHNLVENCHFTIAAHALLAIRSGSYNVIRNNYMTNSYYVKTRAEKLIEVYDVKTDRRSAENPAYMPKPLYDSTKYNLFENNYFGYHPYRPNKGAQSSAMQYSGQCGIIRHNLFFNPRTDEKDKDFPTGIAGGMAMNMRWGGSWEGWVKRKGKGYWLGEGHEAGFVSHNRVFNNTMIGYDNGCVTIPSNGAMLRMKIMDPPPMANTNPCERFHKKFEFIDNEFKNNIMLPEVYEGHIRWAWKQRITGKPVAVVCWGHRANVRFSHNNFFTTHKHADKLIYVPTKENKYTEPNTPAHFDKLYPKTFVGNLQKDPKLVDAMGRKVQLKDGSPMIDAGAHLTAAKGAGDKSTKLLVKDAGYFYDGFGIKGEKGDLIRLAGSEQSARIIGIDYAKNEITLNRPLSWQDGQGVSLAYHGDAPDIGAVEHGNGKEVTFGPKAK